MQSNTLMQRFPIAIFLLPSPMLCWNSQAPHWCRQQKLQHREGCLGTAFLPSEMSLQLSVMQLASGHKEWIASADPTVSFRFFLHFWSKSWNLNMWCVCLKDQKELLHSLGIGLVHLLSLELSENENATCAKLQSSSEDFRGASNWRHTQQRWWKHVNWTKGSVKSFQTSCTMLF